MTIEEFEQLSECFGIQLDNLPEDAKVYGNDGEIIEIIDELIPKDF